VQRSIDKLLSAQERPTSVVVAHRLSTIVGCDRICVLQRGRLIESGTHSQLMQQTDGLCVAALFHVLWIAFAQLTHPFAICAGIFSCSSCRTFTMHPYQLQCWLPFLLPLNRLSRHLLLSAHQFPRPLTSHLASARLLLPALIVLPVPALNSRKS
jgi:hypothetical protein